MYEFWPKPPEALVGDHITVVTLEGPYHLQVKDAKSGELQPVKSFRVKGLQYTGAVFADAAPTQAAGSLGVTLRTPDIDTLDIHGKLRIGKEEINTQLNAKNGQGLVLNMKNRSLKVTIAPVI